MSKLKPNKYYLESAPGGGMDYISEAWAKWAEERIFELEDQNKAYYSSLEFLEDEIKELEDLLNDALEVIKAHAPDHEIIDRLEFEEWPIDIEGGLEFIEEGDELWVDLGPHFYYDPETDSIKELKIEESK